MSHRRVANLIERKTGYLFNNTNEPLEPGVIVRVLDGRLRVAGHVTEWFEGEALEAVRASLSEAERAYDQSESVRSGLGVSLSVDAEGAGSVPKVINGKFGATLAFGVGGGVVFDVTRAAKARTLGSKRRLLLQNALERLGDDLLLVEEVVTTGYVAASATGFGGKIKLSVDATVDPASVGLGNLAELKAAGKLELSVEGGSGWQSSRGEARPLFRAVKVGRIADVLDQTLDALPTFARDVPVESLPALPGVKAQRILATARVAELEGWYGPDEE